MKKVKIIVPIYNALNDVKICLESLKRSIDFTQTDVLLINDASKEDTQSYLEYFVQENTDFILWHNEKNLGFVQTCNRGLSSGGAEIFVLLNSDTEVPMQFVDKIVKCFEHDSSIGIASPITSHHAGYNIPIRKRTVDEMNILLCKRHAPKYYTIPHAEGFCFCIHKNVIDKIGYLDEIYNKGYAEEVDFSFRAIQYGFKNVLIDNLYVIHSQNKSFGAEVREKLMQENSKIFNERWAGFREKYTSENNLKNEVWKIQMKMCIPPKYSFYHDNFRNFLLLFMSAETIRKIKYFFVKKK